MTKITKTVLIVGASSGIGRATAKEFVKEGYEVFNISRSFCDVEGISNHLADVTISKEFKDAIEEVLRQTNGKIDIAIYSAGCSMASPCELVDIEKCRYMFEVNFFGAVNFCKHILPSMRENNLGRIVLIGSLVGRLPIPFLSFYSATKAALETFAEGLNQEIKPLGIHCTLVMPGGTRTNFSYKRDIENTADTCYEKNYQRSTRALRKSEQEGMNTDAVARKIVSALSKKSPPLVVATGINNSLVGAGAKILPEKALGKIMRTKFGR